MLIEMVCLCSNDKLMVISFSTYINRLRVEEFIDIVSNEKMRSYLSAALKVGFSSKATFNRAYKKETGKSPRIYFRMER